jgi:HEAT repeat protein
LKDSAQCGLARIVSALEDVDPVRRKAAAMALGAIGCPDQLIVPEEIAEEKDSQVIGKKKRKKKGTQSKSELHSSNLLESGDESSPKKANQNLKKKRTNRKQKGALLEPIEQPPPPPETLSQVQSRASAALATTCLHDSNAFVRYRAAEAMNSFGNNMTKSLKQMADTALQDENAEARIRASEALGTLGDCRAVHARTFSNLVIDGDPIMQRRAVDALRDLGTAAHPHRKVLNAVTQKSSDESLRLAARHACSYLETRPLGDLGRRIVKQQPSIRVDDLQNGMSNLRSCAADAIIEARCATPIFLRSESLIMLQAKLLA